MKKFIQKHKFYIFIITSIILINAALVGAFLISEMEPSEPSKPPVTEVPKDDLNPGDIDEIPVPPVQYESEIVNFVGNFTSDMNVKLNWKIEENEQKIEKVELYQKGMLLANVSGQSTYQLPMMAYHFVPGPNEFTLRVSMQDGEVVEQKININIDYVFNVQTSYEVDAQGVYISVTYMYSPQTPVLPPNIYLANVSGTSFSVSAIGTEVLSNEPYMKAKTTYYVDVSNLSEGIYNFGLTWDFTNVNRKIDLPMSIIKNDQIIVK